MPFIASLIAGLLFGIGLLISGMANPAKVLNFLDIAGTWDPSLVFVMGGAIAVAAPGFYLLRKRQGPLFAAQFQWPAREDLDSRLLSGAGIFGVGWGLGGFCPGPALAALPMANPATFSFCLAMLVGMAAARLASTKLDKKQKGVTA